MRPSIRASALFLAGVAVTVLLGYVAHGQIRTEQRSTAATTGADRDRIVEQLLAHGLVTGSWQQADDVVVPLSAAMDRRIRLTTEAGAVLVDTDVLVDRRPRRITGSAVRVSLRPELYLRDGEDAAALAVTMLDIRGFRRSVADAGCLVRGGVAIAVVPRPGATAYLGAAPGAAPAAVAAATGRCRDSAPATEELTADTAAVYRCADRSGSERVVLTGCLKRAFAERIAPLTPEPVLLDVSARGTGLELPVTPLAAAAGLLALAAAAWSAAAGWRQFRRLTDASRQLARGDLVPADSAGQVEELHRVVDQLTDSVKQAEERQRERVATVTHELRTPLSNIRAYLEALSDGVIEPEPRLFASLHEEALLQQRIIDDLRRDGLTSEDAATQLRTDVDLAELVRSTWLAHLPAAEAAGVRLTCDTDGPLVIAGDADRLHQVVSNLLGNAVRYTPAGGQAEVRSRREGGQALLQVYDTGIGIAPDDLPWVFDRSWRSDAARRLVAGGSGLGLAITREIVVDHGGAVFVDSRLGRGTTFTVFLPLGDTVPGPGEAPDVGAGRRFSQELT